MADISSVNVGGTEYDFKDTEARKLLADTVGWTGKNKNSLPYYEMSKTYNGIKYDVLDGGTVVANRTGSAQDSNLVLHYREKSYAYPLILPNGHYFVTGCPVGGSESTYCIEANITKNGARQILGYDTGNGLEIDLTGDDYSNTETCLGLTIHIKAATATVSNLTFTPMVSDTGLPYESYHDSVKETLQDAEVIEGKNLFNETRKGVFLWGAVNDGYSVSAGANGFIAIGKVETGKQYVVSKNAVGNRFKLVLFKTYPTSTPDHNTVLVYENAGATDYTFTVPSGGYNYIVAGLNNTDAYSGDIQSMLCTKEEWDKSHEYKPYYEPLKDRKLDRAEQRVLGAKNLLNNKALTTTSNGVTFTVNADGTITVSTEPSGATGNVFVRVANFSNNECLLNKGNYILNGTPNGGGSFAYFMYVTDNVSAYRDYGNGVEFAIGSDNQSVSVVIYVISGTIITTPITFKPMIRLASDPDGTYVPYAMTNKELTDTNALDDSEFTPAANISIIGNWSAKWGKLIQVALLFRTSAAINANTAIFTMPNYKLANGKTNGTVMGCPLIMQNGAVNTIIQCDMPSADGAVKFRNLVTLTSAGDYKLSMLFICK